MWDPSRDRRERRERAQRSARSKRSAKTKAANRNRSFDEHVEDAYLESSDETRIAEPKDLYGDQECAVCGERFKSAYDGDGIAEMYDPNSDTKPMDIGDVTIQVHEHYVVHHLCGSEKGWQLA